MSDTLSAHAPEPSGESWLERLLSRFGSRSRDSMRGDLEEVLSHTEEGADLTPRERLMLRNVLSFHRLRVSDVMIPRADMVAISVATTLGDALALFRTAGHSRLPAYGETLDEPLGMIHLRDFVDFLARTASDGTASPGMASPGTPPDAAARDGNATPDLGRVDLGATLEAASLLRPVLFVPRSMPAIDLLARMQASRTHMALVIDEYGGTDGLVSMEDLVETVVGDIEDEHDEPDSMLVRADDGSLVADARIGLDEVADALGQDRAAFAASEEVDTLGGMIVTSVGRVPARGEIIAGPADLEFEVLDGDPRRIRQVRISRRSTPPADGAGGDALPTGDPGGRT